ncbi:MAG: sugar ABC transporter permease, partial [Acetatifactor sp.]|nr:sugar ABC transporter permease [Acetatifactor sp.]
MGIKKKKAQPVYDRPGDAATSQVFKKGNTVTKASFFVFGLGNLMNRQIGRGLFFLALEIAYFIYLFTFGIGALGDFITLGTAQQGEVYNAALGIYEYSAGDDSMLCLLYGVITLVLTAAIVFLGCMSGKSAYCTQV